MARPIQRAGDTPTKRLAEDGDICPVCKSSRYLNQNMRFLVNPECYHRMCESCVDRIFSHGPTLCPIAGCKRTLRKVRFRHQTFEDLKIEREVDIRRRVAKAFNLTEDDFETLRDYNDYLEVVEDTVWNLVNRVDVAKTNERLDRFAELRKLEQAQLSMPSGASTPRDTHTPDPSSRSMLKKTLRKGIDRSQASTPDPSTIDLSAVDPATTFVFKGLKKREAPEPEKPLDPFGSYSFEPLYYVQQESYEVPHWLGGFKDDPDYVTGGWKINNYYSRCLTEAFGGFSVFIQDEVATRKVGMDAHANIMAALGIDMDVKMDDA